MSLFFGGGSQRAADRITITFDGERPTKKVGAGATEMELPIFTSGEVRRNILIHSRSPSTPPTEDEPRSTPSLAPANHPG